MLGAFVVAAISSRRNIHIVVLFMLLLVFAALIFRGFDADQNMISQRSYPHFTAADPPPNKSQHWLLLAGTSRPGDKITNGGC